MKRKIKDVKYSCFIGMIRLKGFTELLGLGLLILFVMSRLQMIFLLTSNIF